MEDAINALYEVSGRLAYGDYDVIEVLGEIAPALPVPAQRAVNAALDASGPSLGTP